MELHTKDILVLKEEEEDEKKRKEKKGKSGKYSCPVWNHSKFKIGCPDGFFSYNLQDNIRG